MSTKPRHTPAIHHLQSNSLYLLQQANQTMRMGDYVLAIQQYIQYLLYVVEPVPGITTNLHICQLKYRRQRQQKQNKLSVGISCWNLGDNPAGRAHTLATIYQRFAQVELLGCLIPSFGHQVWEPIRNTDIPIHSFVAEDEAQFIRQAIELVAAHPYDLVHLSKPRMHNIIFGLLYKCIWGAAVLMDVDDEELAFVKADQPFNLRDYLSQHGQLPPLTDLRGKIWTQIAVGLVNAFDGITVCNQALQQRYGGTIIRHARDETKLKPFDAQKKRAKRQHYGIAPTDKVVLFFGTPRRHKGLLETAQAIASLNRPDILFLIVGRFPEPLLKQELQAISGCRFKFLDNQSVEKIPEILALADCCVLLQDTDSVAAQYQTPAKLTDALAMGVPVIASATQGLQVEIKNKIVTLIKYGEYANQIESILTQKHKDSISYFNSYFAINKIAHRLEKLVLGNNNKSEDFQQKNTLLLKIKQASNNKLGILCAELRKEIFLKSIISSGVEKKSSIIINNKYFDLQKKLLKWEGINKLKRNPDIISIVIPIFNQINLTKKCIDSIYNVKSNFKFEIICVNNGSNDEMANYLDGQASLHPNLKHIKNKENYNFALGCNIGFSHAIGEYIVFLNNDTEVSDYWLSWLIEPLIQDKEIHAVQPKLLYPDGKIQNIGIVFNSRQVFGYPIYADFSSHIPCTRISRKYQAVTGACIAVRAKDFIAVKGFDSIFINGMEDVDLCLRLAQYTGGACYYQASVEVVHHESKTEGRGKHIDTNRSIFLARWDGKVISDDISFYAKDGYTIIGWKKDKEERRLKNISIDKPVLKYLN